MTYLLIKVTISFTFMDYNYKNLPMAFRIHSDFIPVFASIAFIIITSSFSKVLKTKNCGELSLYVTHGIFSKGLDVLFEHFDYVYTTDSIYKGDDPRINIIELHGC